MNRALAVVRFATLAKKLWSGVVLMLRFFSEPDGVDFRLGGEPDVGKPHVRFDEETGFGRAPLTLSTKCNNGKGFLQKATS